MHSRLAVTSISRSEFEQLAVIAEAVREIEELTHGIERIAAAQIQQGKSGFPDLKLMSCIGRA
jgi:hypothetical protein